jgi:GTP-binding protein
MDQEATVRRAVAIVGRPNVGKSSIFNLLAGRRIAIVHEERGVTRDRLIAEVQWNERRFELIDTGGLGRLEPSKRDMPASCAEIASGVRRQAEAAIRDAAAILFVTDVSAGILPQDEEVGALLRKSGRPVFMAANKADNPERAAGVVEFARLGFPVFPVSVLHRLGFDPLMRAVIEALPQGANPTVTRPLKIAFVGRPNVGKSSVVNRLLRSDRMIVSAQPGTTRDSIDIPFVIGRDAQARHYILTDTAGLRRSGKIPSPVDYLGVARTEQSIGRADVIGLVLDAAQGPTAQDMTIAARIVASKKGCVLIVNKWDLMKNVTEANYRAALWRAMPFCDFMPVVFVSAQTGFNIRSLVETIDAVALHLQTTLPTGVLNRVIMATYAKTSPPLVQGKRLKIFYATQATARPMVILLFVNDPGRLVPAYQSYLVRQLRSAFGLEGVPVTLQLRARRASPGEDDNKAYAHANRTGSRSSAGAERHSSQRRFGPRETTKKYRSGGRS